jgi:hypothetical protein
VPSGEEAFSFWDLWSFLSVFLVTDGKALSQKDLPFSSEFQSSMVLSVFPPRFRR